MAGLMFSAILPTADIQPCHRQGMSKAYRVTLQIGDPDHLKVFANVDAAAKWFEENDPEGVAFEYQVLE